MDEAAKDLEHHPTTRMPRLTSHRVEVAIEARQFYSVYQPIVDLRTGGTYGYEALARCELPDLASPLQLLRAAAGERMLGRLGRELRRTAVAAHPGNRLFLNIHPDEFDEPFLTMLDDPMFNVDEVYLEITEAAPLTHYRFCRDVLDELRSRGVRLVIDDFGAGYSNVMYVAELAPDIVKLDRTLVTGVHQGTRQHTLLRSLVAMCADQGATVIAEGIETQIELDAVRSAGIELCQGYFLGRPARGGVEA